MKRLPYHGLRPFKRDETDIFFGREQHTDALIKKLGQQHFLAVLGASGCGKSSLVYTGLLDGLEGGFLASAGSAWQIADFRPGNQPFKQMAEALFKKTELGVEHYGLHFEDSAQALAFLQADLQRGERSLTEILTQYPLVPGENLLLLVDQFEEIFRYYQQGGEEQAAAFVALLLQVSRLDHVYVVITMRSDFIGDCAVFKDLPEAINRSLYLTPRLNRLQLEEAIAAPAEVFGGGVEPALVQRLLNDAGDSPDQLPLLQHVLMLLWDRCSEDKSREPELTLAAYESLGGLDDALSAHADRVFSALTVKQQRLARVLFCSLTERSEKRDTRRPLVLQEVADLAVVDWPLLARVVEVFRAPGRSFLMPPLPEPLKPESVLDISHESLIRQWQRLQGWVNEEAEAAALFRRLADSALLWKQGKAALLQSPELETALFWWDDFKPTAIWAQRYCTDCRDQQAVPVFDLLEDYLQQSQAAKQADIKAQQRQQQQKIEQARKLTVVMLVALLLAVGLAAWAFQERGKAENALVNVSAAEKRTAELEKQRTSELFDSHVTHASLLAKGEDYAGAKAVLEQSYALDEDVSSKARHARNLLASFTEIKGGVADMVYRGAGFPLKAAAVSPDGTLLAAAGEQGTLVLFDVQTGELLQRLQGHSKDAGGTSSVREIAFTPQGDRLISGGDDKQIILWQRQGRQFSLLKRLIATDEVNAVAVSPDGKLLATGGDDNAITLWELASGDKIRSLKKHTARISERGLVFNATGELLASASYDDSAIIWDVETGKALHTLSGHTNDVFNVAFSADSKILVTSSDDKTVRLWRVSDGQPLRVLSGHENGVFAVDFIANSSLLVSGSFDRSIRLWDSRSGVSLRLLQGHEAGIGDIASHGSSLFSASNDGTVRRWSLALPYQQHIPLPGEPASNAISPNLDTIAVGFADGGLRVYDATQGQMLWENANAHQSKTKILAFNSKRDLLASGSFDKTAKIWSVDSSEQQGTYSMEGAASIYLQEQQTFTGHTNAIHGLAFSPDSQTLATASYDGNIGLFTLNGEQAPLLIPAHQGIVASVSFNNKGTLLLSAGNEDRSIRLWDLSTQPPSLSKETIPKANDMLLWSSLSPDNQWIAGVGRGNSRLTVYNRKTQQNNRLLGHENTVYKAIFAPDSQQLATVSMDATVRFWNSAKSNELFSLRLPTNRGYPAPMWDFDFRCLEADCRLAIPLTNGNLMLYRLAYEGKLSPTAAEQKRGLLTLWLDYLNQVGTLSKQNALPAAQQAMTEANSIGEPLIEQYPDDVLILQTAIRAYVQSAQLHLSLKNTSSALAVYQKAINVSEKWVSKQPQFVEPIDTLIYFIKQYSVLLNTDNNSELTGAIYQRLFLLPLENAMGLILRAKFAHEVANKNAVEKDLQKAFEYLDKQNHEELNNLGYNLSNLTTRYQDAYQLLQQALVLQPENANYLDSMGWILYKMGKNKQALEHLQKAFSKKEGLYEGAFSEVTAHLGEVLWILGEKKQAKKIWKQGLKDDSDSKILLETMKRLNKK